jgi:hypothetical protein
MMIPTIKRTTRALFMTTILLLTPAASGAVKNDNAPPWTVLARHVGQNEKASAVAIAKLRKTKDIEKTLTSALGTKDRFLALDVIAALRLTDMIPRLVENIPEDDDGFTTLTVNALIDSKNKSLVLSTYERHIASGTDALSPAAIVAMLEPLGRLNHPLPKAALKRLAAHEYPEVVSAALLYARTRSIGHQSKEPLEMLHQTLDSPSAQIRIQSLYLADEIAGLETLRPAIEQARLKSVCAKERTPMVKSKCNETLSRWGSKP